MLLNKTLNESVGNKPLFAYCTLGRMVFSFHHAFFSKNFWVHPGLNELHMMFPGSREKLPFFISLLGLDNRSIAVCKHIPYHSPLSPRPYLMLADLCVVASLANLSFFPDMGSIQERCNLCSFQVRLIRAYEGGWRQPSSLLLSYPKFKKILSILYVL